MTTISTPELTSQAQTVDFSHLPHLWVSDSSYTLGLKQFFHISFYGEQLSNQFHYIAFDSEAESRATYYRIKAAQPDAQILFLPLDTSFAAWLWNQAKNPFEALVMSCVPYQTWHNHQKIKSLDADEAAAIAAGLLTQQLCPVTLTIELESLRKRCGMSSYKWDKFIADLEAEIHAAVDGRANAIANAQANAQDQPTSKTQRLKLDLSAYIRITDPFEQAIERMQLQSTYRIDNKTFERLCRALRDAENRSAKTVRRLPLIEAMNLESHALSWLVPGFVPAKTSILLSGLPGCGKSLLSVDIAWAITRGESFLGELCRKGKVLLINSDQLLNITVSYLADRGFDENNTDLEVVGQSGDLPAWTVRDLDALEAWMDEFQPDFVVIDSIRTTICYPLGLEEKSEQVGHWMKEVERIVCRKASLLWIHHDNKDKELKGVSRSSGSTAIPGNVSVHWRLEATSADPSNRERQLSMPKTRGFEGSTINIRFNPETNGFEYLGRAGESVAQAHERQTLARIIYDLLSQCPGVGMEGSQIRQALGLTGDTVYQVLGRMISRGQISKRRSPNSKGKIYFIPDSERPDCDSSSEEPSPTRLCESDCQVEDECIDIQTSQTPDTIPDTIPDTPPDTPPEIPVLDDQEACQLDVTATPDSDASGQGGGTTDCASLSEDVDPIIGATVRYVGSDSSLKRKYGHFQLTAVQITSKGFSRTSDHIRCQLPNGQSHIFPRYTLKVDRNRR